MRILECRLEGGGVGILYQLQDEGLCLWDLGLQDEQLERAGMALGGKDVRGAATGTREVSGILKMRTKLELHTKKLREGVCYGVEAAPEDSHSQLGVPALGRKVAGGASTISALSISAPPPHGIDHIPRVWQAGLWLVLQTGHGVRVLSR